MAHSKLAAPLLSSSLALHEELGLKVPLDQETRDEVILADLRGQLDGTTYADARKRGQALTLGEAVATCGR